MSALPVVETQDFRKCRVRTSVSCFATTFMPSPRSLPPQLSLLINVRAARLVCVCELFNCFYKHGCCSGRDASDSNEGAETCGECSCCVGRSWSIVHTGGLNCEKSLFKPIIKFGFPQVHPHFAMRSHLGQLQLERVVGTFQI